MEDERIITHVHELGQILLVLADIDDPAGVVAEEAEVLVHMQIDRRRLDARVIQGVDDDVARGERLAYRAIRENHARQTIVCSSHRGCSSMVERQLPKLDTRVRFPSPALGASKITSR